MAMQQIANVCFILIFVCFFYAKGQTAAPAFSDTAVEKTAAPEAVTAVTNQESSAARAEAGATVLNPRIAKYDYDAMPKDPLASAFFSATIPGTGQIYNKEYVRGILTGAAFYLSLMTIYYEVYRWEQLNTDTFWIEEAMVPEEDRRNFRATAPKPEDEQVGLPGAEKAVLGVSVVLCAASYIFGIIDSYNGANRYNRNLFTLNGNRNVRLSLKAGEQIGLTARIDF